MSFTTLLGIVAVAMGMFVFTMATVISLAYFVWLVVRRMTEGPRPEVLRDDGDSPFLDRLDRDG